MRQKILITILLSFAYFSMRAQEVTNADYYEKDKKVYITYSLSKEADISLYVSVNDSPYERVSLYHLEGDIGSNVKAGKNKLIIWDVLADREHLVGNIQFKITASESLNSFTKRIKKEKSSTQKKSSKSNYSYICDRFYSNAGTANIAFFEVGVGLVLKNNIAVPAYLSAFTFRYKMIEVALGTFSYDCMYLTTDNPRGGFYWKPQARVVVPISDSFAFVPSIGPAIHFSHTDHWFLVTARFRYIIESINGYVDFYGGYEDRGFTIGISLSYSLSIH